jgi:hypothetical protein
LQKELVRFDVWHDPRCFHVIYQGPSLVFHATIPKELHRGVVRKKIWLETKLLHLFQGLYKGDVTAKIDGLSELQVEGRDAGRRHSVLPKRPWCGSRYPVYLSFFRRATEAGF